jgi:cytochrome c553
MIFINKSLYRLKPIRGERNEGCHYPMTAFSFSAMLILLFSSCASPQNPPVIKKSPIQLYLSCCSGCHGMNGEGGAGPSFLDNEFIYGSQKNITTYIIKNGTGERGMPAWREILSEKEIYILSDYIISLQRESNKSKRKL